MPKQLEISNKLFQAKIMNLTSFYVANQRQLVPMEIQTRPELEPQNLTARQQIQGVLTIAQNLLNLQLLSLARLNRLKLLNKLLPALTLYSTSHQTAGCRRRNR